LVNAAMSQIDVAALLTVLSAEERARAASAQSRVDARRYISAHGAARYILGLYMGIQPQDVRWQVGPQGKPAIHGVEFSLSHSGELSMIAISAHRPVGVDIQEIVAGLDVLALARRFFPVPEAQEVLAASDPGLAFARLWARKEAVIKVDGGRLMPGLAIAVQGSRSELVGRSQARPHRVTDLPVPAGYQAAVALAGPEPYEVTMLDWSPAPNRSAER
jgi:4'-phosphopantetheinyl transferase